MAVPSIVGAVTQDQVNSSDTTLSFDHTIAADTDAVVVLLTSYSAGAEQEVTSATINSQNLTLTPNTDIWSLGGSNGTWFYYMTSSDANWPGVGTFSISFTLTGPQQQKRWAAVNFQNVDTSSPIASSAGQAQSSSTTWSLPAMTSTTNDLPLAGAIFWPATFESDAANTDIASQVSGGGDLYLFSRVGQASSTTMSFDLSAASQGPMAGLVLRGTTEGGSGISIDATLSSLTASGSASLNQVERTASGSATFSSLEVGGGFYDDFSGSGDIGFTTYQESALPDVTRTGGRYRANLTDNASNVTLWFNTFQGRGDYKQVTFPFEIIVRNIGIGTQADSQIAPTSSGEPFSFAGVQIHTDPLSSVNSSHIVVGHRGGTGFTIEGKNTVNSVSTVTDEGANSAPDGRADIRIVGNEDNTLTVYWQLPGTSPDNWTLYADTGNLPGTAPTYPDTVYAGLITYAQNSQGVPFVGTADSFRIVGAESGSATLNRKATASNSLSSLTASGSATINPVQTEPDDYTASGNASMPSLTASGIAVLKRAASGSAEFSSLEVSSVITQLDEAELTGSNDFTIDIGMGI